MCVHVEAMCVAHENVFLWESELEHLRRRACAALAPPLSIGYSEGRQPWPCWVRKRTTTDMCNRWSTLTMHGIMEGLLGRKLVPCHPSTRRCVRRHRGEFANTAPPS